MFYYEFSNMLLYIPYPCGVNIFRHSYTRVHVINICIFSIIQSGEGDAENITYSTPITYNMLPLAFTHAIYTVLPAYKDPVFFPERMHRIG